MGVRFIHFKFCGLDVEFVFVPDHCPSVHLLDTKELMIMTETIVSELLI